MNFIQFGLFQNQINRRKPTLWTSPLVNTYARISIDFKCRRNGLALSHYQKLKAFISSSVL